MKPRMLSSARLPFSLAAAVAALITAPSALAATLFWDGGTVDIAGNGDGAGTNASGTWSTSISNWDNGAGVAHVVWTNGTNIAQFEGGTNTITLGSAITVGRINQIGGGSGITISGGGNAITLGSASTVFSVAASTTVGRSMAVNAVVTATGSNALSVVGPTSTAGGSVSLNAINTYTGNTTINNTTLTIGAAGQLNSGNYAGAISLATASSFLTYGSSLNQTLGGNITGTGKLTKGTSASSILILSGASNTYSGGTAVNAGTLTFQNTTAKPASGTVTVAAAATLGLGVAASGSFFTSADVNSLFAGTLSGVTNDATSNVGIDTTQGDFTHSTSIGGSPTRGLVKLGANILTLSGTNTYTGATNIKTGTILMSGSGTLGTGAPLILSGGNLDLGTTSQTVGAVDVSTPAASGSAILNGSLTGTSYAASNTSGNTIISANLLVNGAAAFTKTGAGTASLSGTNTYTGGTAVNVGALTFLNTGAKPVSGTVTVAAGATLGLGVATSGSFFTSADVDSLFAGTLIDVTNDATSFAGIDTTQGDFTYATSVSGSPTRGLAKLGANTLTLTGSNTFTGGVSVTAGTLLLGTTGALNSTAGSENAVTFGASTTGTLALAGNSVVISNLNGSAVGPVVTNANGSSVSNATLTVGNSLNLGGTYTGILQDGTGGGTLSLTKAGTGVLVLSGANTYTGVTNINAGSIRITNAGALGTTGGNTVVASGGELVSNSALTVAEPFNIAGLGLAGSTGALHTGGNVTSTFTGAITLSANSGFQGDGGTTTTLSGGIDTAGFSFTNNGSGNVTVSTVGISGVGGSLIKNIGGTLSLNAANTYSGSTTINAGILSLGNVNALQNTSGISMAAGTTLRASVTGITIAAPITLSGAGNTSFMANVAAGSTTTINGAIGGATGNVVYTTNTPSFGNTSSNFIIGAAGTYTGNTLITTGDGANNPVFLKTGIVNALPTTTVLTFAQVNGGGTGRTFQYDLNGFNQTLAGLDNGGLLPQVRRMLVTSATAAELTINNSSNYTFGGSTISTSVGTIGSLTRAQITGAIALTKSGTGTFTLGGTLAGGATAGGNTFTGDTKILGGILSLGEPLSLQNSALDTANSITGDATNGLQSTVTSLRLGGLTGNKNLAGVFETTAGGYGTVTDLTLNPGTGKTPSYTGAIADGAPGMTLTKSGAGTQTLSGANSYTGATTVSAGTLALGANNALPDTAVSIGNATLDAATFSDTLGTLDATSTAKINLGAGASLAFADSSAIDWTGGALNITGTFVSGSSLRFGTTSAGLTPAQLALISATGFGSFALNASGYLTATAGGYSSWAAVNAIGSTPDQDKDGDGVSNAVEYVIGGTVTTNDLSKLPAVSTSGGNLLFTFQRDQASIDGSTTVTIQVGTTLLTWPDSYSVPGPAQAIVPGVTIVKDTSVGFDTVTLSIPQGLDATKFARLNVVVTP